MQHPPCSIHSPPARHPLAIRSPSARHSLHPTTLTTPLYPTALNTTLATTLTTTLAIPPPTRYEIELENIEGAFMAEREELLSSNKSEIDSLFDRRRESELAYMEAKQKR